MKRKADSRGFTMVEVLVSTLITSFIGIVIYMTLSQGIRLWHYALRDRPEWQIDIFFDKLSTQLRNATACKKPPLQGTEQSIEFCMPGPSQSTGDSLAGEVRLLWGMKYYFDPIQKTVFKVQKPYQQVVLPKTGAGTPEPVLSGIREFRLEYYVHDDKKGTWVWKRKWESQCLPRAVKLSMDYGKDRQKSINRFFPLMPSESCSNGEKS